MRDIGICVVILFVGIVMGLIISPAINPWPNLPKLTSKAETFDDVDGQVLQLVEMTLAEVLAGRVRQIGLAHVMYDGSLRVSYKNRDDNKKALPAAIAKLLDRVSGDI